MALMPLAALTCPGCPDARHYLVKSNTGAISHITKLVFVPMLALSHSLPMGKTFTKRGMMQSVTDGSRKQMHFPMGKGAGM